MKNRTVYVYLLFVLMVAFSCKITEKTIEVAVYTDSLQINAPNQMAFHFKKGKSFNHPTFVLWEEDMNGSYQKTLFITKSYSSGIFGHQMVGDSIWLNKSGSSYQPAALPYWTHKKGPITGRQFIPTPEHPFVDAYSGATPKNNFQFLTGKENVTGQHRILLEVNQAWDWNAYWTNNKYPDSQAYKNSAQPSLIYEVVINQADSSYFFKPIGHGDPTGETGKLFTDISSLTTAKEIYETVQVVVKR